ncbi:hypothetical protein AB0F81_08530 [Actinoplanes sp. NPDC024001]|uniref:hypothetical protein n=1 Tax=Actinoplanes sp. NPDC024001 TaxID=3154598 RepID=UPI0033DE5EC6
MPHLPDDDGLVPPLKVLRKRLNGVYREDLGFSGPTRRYVLMVVLLVGLASVPTLAVITAGSNEISGGDRPGALDAPFLPPPVAGPVRPSPTVSPAPADTADSSEKDHSKRRVDRDQKVIEPERWERRRDDADAVSEPPKRLKRTKAKLAAAAVPRRRAVHDRPVAPERPVVSDLPKVPDLPVVPEDTDVSRPKPPADFPTLPDLPEVPSEQDEHPRSRHDTPAPDEPHPARRRPCEDAAVPEPGSRRRAERTAPVAPPADGPPRSTVHNSSSRRSAVTERPQNIRAARILERSYAGGGGNVRRSMIPQRTDEHRNRPYRGVHRAEEWEPGWQRSTRVGRHHADPHDEHRANHR